MTYPVAALYVESGGKYPHLAAQWFDEERDARTYRGPLPVVAHPPCGPWGRLATFCKHDDPELARTAVHQVRQFGGVLEHPAGSRLWREFMLPAPDSLFEDEWGGRTYEVAQGDYGHRAPKLTWLYAVRLGPCPFHLPRRDPGHRVALMGAPERRATPIEFARALCAWASTHSER